MSRRERPKESLGELVTAAGDIMRWLNEAETCPICGVWSGEHEPGALCQKLWDALGREEP